MNNQLEKDFQLLGLHTTATELEVKARFRQLSAHAHPDKYEKGTKDYAEALAKQTRLNCARDRILEHIKNSNRAKENQEQEKSPPDGYLGGYRQGAHLLQEEGGKGSFDEIPKATDFIRIRSVFRSDLETAEGNDAAALLIFLVLVFIGVAAASLVATVFPILVTGAPLVLIGVMLGTMFLAAKKLKEWCVR